MSRARLRGGRQEKEYIWLVAFWSVVLTVIMDGYDLLLTAQKVDYYLLYLSTSVISAPLSTLHILARTVDGSAAGDTVKEGARGRC